MVARLKTECGSAFTAKLEGMFKDVELAKELGTQFSGSKHAVELGVDVGVHVLTSSYWPTYTFMPAILPAEVRGLPKGLAGHRCSACACAHAARPSPSLPSPPLPSPPSPQLAKPAAAFEAFYAAKYSSNRRLQWQHSLGHCLVKAAFPGGRKELDVSLTQTLVLLLFNGGGGAAGGGSSGTGGDAIPFPRIRDDTGLEDAEARRTLQSLACGQVRVLRKEPKVRARGGRAEPPARCSRVRAVGNPSLCRPSPALCPPLPSPSCRAATWRTATCSTSTRSSRRR